MKSNLLIAITVLTSLSLPQAYAAPVSPREKARLEAIEKETLKDREVRVEQTQAVIRTGKAEDVIHATDSSLSMFSGGRIDTIQLDLARKTQYVVEVQNRGGLSTRAVEIKISEMADKLAKNMTDLETTRTNNMSPDAIALHASKVDLGRSTAQLLTLAAKRYEGSNTDLVLARDAFARQVETAVKIISKESAANRDEVAQHVEVVDAINRAKEQNPALTDAEATSAGVAKAYRDGFEQRCKDGSCRVPSEEVLAAGAKTRLKDLKECI